MRYPWRLLARRNQTQELSEARRQRLIVEMSLDTIFEGQASPLVRSALQV